MSQLKAKTVRGVRLPPAREARQHRTLDERILVRFPGLVPRLVGAWMLLPHPSRLRRAMLEAEREVFRQARDEGRIPEEVLRRAQRDLDLEESLLQREE